MNDNFCGLKKKMSGQRNYFGKRSHSPGDYIDNGGGKRRGAGDEKEPSTPGPDDSVYRYLCKVKQIGSIIGKGGKNVKQLKVDTHAIIRIGESVPRCDERVVAIFSSSKETGSYGDTSICPAQDALFRIHFMLTSDEVMDEYSDKNGFAVTARLLVPTDQIGCLLGKGGHIIQGLRSDTGARIHILTDHLPACAMNGDELLQVSGQPPVVKKALLLLTSRLRDNPSRSNHLLASNVPSIYSSGNRYDPPMAVVSPPVSRYRSGYRGDREWMPYHLSRRDRMPAVDFSLRLLCPSANVGGVIGKAGSVIKQIKQDSGANIIVDSVEDDCVITISAKEHPDDPISQSVDAAVRMQPRCSERVDNESGVLITTRMLVPTSQIGCLIGKGGTIISDMRTATRADIRILSKEHLPKVASEDDEMVQISGDINIAREALIQVTTKLKSNVFESEGALSQTSSVPCASTLHRYERQYSSWRRDRDSPPDKHGNSYSRGYDRGAHHSGRYGSYGGSQGGGSTYGGGYSGHSGNVRSADPNHSYRRHNGY